MVSAVSPREQASWPVLEQMHAYLLRIKDELRKQLPPAMSTASPQPSDAGYVLRKSRPASSVSADSMTAAR
jgi:hypothetical protein